MSDTSVPAPVSPSVPEAPTPAPPPAPAAFVAPPGYVLVPQAMYDLLMKQANQPPQVVVREAAPSNEVTDKHGRRSTGKKMPVIYLKVLRPIHLGDIKTNLNPDETVEWIPTQSITIRGKKHEDLGSFLAVWNAQWPGSPRFDRNFKPVFEIPDEQMDELTTAIGAPRRGGPARRPGSSLEGDRIRREENPPARPRPRTAARMEGVEMADVDDDSYEEGYDEDYVDENGLPPQGTEERRELIEQACLGVRPRPGHEQDEVESPDTFATTRRSQDYRTVAKIPGKPADEGKRRTRRERR